MHGTTRLATTAYGASGEKVVNVVLVEQEVIRGCARLLAVRGGCQNILNTSNFIFTHFFGGHQVKR